MLLVMEIVRRRGCRRFGSFQVLNDFAGRDLRTWLPFWWLVWRGMEARFRSRNGLNGNTIFYALGALFWRYRFRLGGQDFISHGVLDSCILHQLWDQICRAQIMRRELLYHKLLC